MKQEKEEMVAPIGKGDTTNIKKEKETAVDEGDAASIKKEEETGNLSKAAPGSAAVLFDKQLFHVLTRILRLRIDTRDSYIREYLRLRKVEYWEDLENHVLGNYIPQEDPDTGKDME